MTKSHLRAAAVGAAALICVPLGITATTASWNDREWVHGQLGTSSLACDDDTQLAATASGRFLSGSLLGIDLDAVAELQQMTLALDGDGALAVEPPGAIDLGSAPPTYTYANPFDLDVLDIVGVDLTGFTIGLPGVDAGAVNQYAQVSAGGTVAGASGLVNNSGAVLVRDDTPPDELPAPATVDIGELLPVLSGVTDARLEVGAVGASSVLDGCAALLEQTWGIAPGSPVSVRDYGIAGLGLEVDAPIVEALVADVNDLVLDLTEAVDSLIGSDGLISQSVATNLDLNVLGLATAGVAGEVTITGLDLAEAVEALLTTPLTGNGFIVDLQNGSIEIDLTRLTGPLNDAGPNTELVIDSGAVNAVLAEAGTLLDDLVADVLATLDAALQDAELHVHLDTSITAIGLTLASVSIDVDASIGDLLSDEASVSVVPIANGLLPGTINTLLGLAGLPTLDDILGLVTATTADVTDGVVGALTSTVFDLLDDLGADLAGAVAPIITALDGVLAALPSVVSLMVNVQPDQAGAPPGATFQQATADATAEYRVSALRIGLADVLDPLSVAYVTLATATAGPVSSP